MIEGVIYKDVYGLIPSTPLLNALVMYIRGVRWATLYIICIGTPTTEWAASVRCG